jgi:hypothetical protein
VAVLLGYGASAGYIKKQNSDTAAAAGFENWREYSSARAAGFSDAVKWRS